MTTDRATDDLCKIIWCLIQLSGGGFVIPPRLWAIARPNDVFTTQEEGVDMICVTDQLAPEVMDYLQATLPEHMR